MNVIATKIFSIIQEHASEAFDIGWNGALELAALLVERRLNGLANERDAIAAEIRNLARNQGRES